MSSQFSSFDQSAVRGFVESPGRERNGMRAERVEVAHHRWSGFNRRVEGLGAIGTPEFFETMVGSSGRLPNPWPDNGLHYLTLRTRLVSFDYFDDGATLIITDKSRESLIEVHRHFSDVFRVRLSDSAAGNFYASWEKHDDGTETTLDTGYRTEQANHMLTWDSFLGQAANPIRFIKSEGTSDTTWREVWEFDPGGRPVDPADHKLQIVYEVEVAQAYSREDLRDDAVDMLARVPIADSGALWQFNGGTSARKLSDGEIYGLTWRRFAHADSGRIPYLRAIALPAPVAIDFAVQAPADAAVQKGWFVRVTDDEFPYGPRVLLESEFRTMPGSYPLGALIDERGSVGEGAFAVSTLSPSRAGLARQEVELGSFLNALEGNPTTPGVSDFQGRTRTLRRSLSGASLSEAKEVGPESGFIFLRRE